MPRIVHCKKLDKDLPGLPFKPFEGEFGQKLYDEISLDAWKEWLNFSVRYVNTYRLDLADKKAQEFLQKQCSIYFGYEQGEEAQTAWVPPTK